MSPNDNKADTPLTLTQTALYMRLEIEREHSDFDYSIHPQEEWPEDWMDRAAKKKDA